MSKKEKDEEQIPFLVLMFLYFIRALMFGMGVFVFIMTVTDLIPFDLWIWRHQGWQEGIPFAFMCAISGGLSLILAILGAIGPNGLRKIFQS